MILQVYPVHHLVVPYCMLQQHNFNGIFGIFTGEFAFANHGVNADTKGVDAFIWVLAEVRKNFIMIMTKVYILLL